MYIEIKRTCGECGSQKYETFQQGTDISGIRCLNCGHEQITTITTTSSHEGISWVTVSDFNTF